MTRNIYPSVNHRHADRKVTRPVWKTDIRNKFDAMAVGEHRDLLYKEGRGWPIEVSMTKETAEHCEFVVVFEGQVSERNSVHVRDLAWHLENIWLEMIAK